MNNIIARTRIKFRLLNVARLIEQVFLLIHEVAIGVLLCDEFLRTDVPD